jgi:hypothetical protein
MQPAHWLYRAAFERLDGAGHSGDLFGIPRLLVQSRVIMSWGFAAEQRGSCNANRKRIPDRATGHPKRCPGSPSANSASDPKQGELPGPGLWLIGLAIAVALWGFGYKLSRYNLHSDISSRASFARLWDKHQDSAQVAENAKLTPQSHLGLETQAIFALLQDTPELERPAGCHSEKPKLILLWSSSLLPLRSLPPVSGLVQLRFSARMHPRAR